MKKFWIGLLTGALAVPAIFFGTTAIVAKANNRTIDEQLHHQVEQVFEKETSEDETLQDEVIEDEVTEENTEIQE